MSQRLDKWLVYARFLRHRAEAQKLVEDGAVRVNRQRVLKCSHTVKPDDVLTIAFYGRVRVVKVLGESERRGSATAARALYAEITDTHTSEAEKQDASPGPVC